MTALPPPATTMRTVAAPSPEAPPVTMNVLPSSCMRQFSVGSWFIAGTVGAVTSAAP